MTEKKFSSAMSRAQNIKDELAGLLKCIGDSLGMELDVCTTAAMSDGSIEDLGPVEDRASYIHKQLNAVNEYVSSTEPTSTRDLRLFVVEFIPRFLLAYQALRFPVISDSSSSGLPTKSDLSTFPEVIYDTGLFVPVSACLRLIAVSLTDTESKQKLIDAGNVKTIVSHMVDDPLNPFQREAAVFVVNVFTRDFPPGQLAVSSVMTPRT